MACGTIFDGFRVATEALSSEIYNRAKFTTPLLSAVPEGRFPKNVGSTISIFNVEANELTTENTGGSAVTASDACNYSWTDLSIGFTETTYSPKKLQYRGPIFCKDAKYFEHSPEEFISKYLDHMSSAVAQDFESFLFYHYARMVPIYVATSTGFNSLGSVSTTLTAAAANSELTQSMLDKLVPLLIAERALPSTTDGNGFVSLDGPAGPLWTLLIGIEASNRIKKNNTEHRTDLRYANPNSLLNRMGATEAIRNFRHLPWVLPMRFSHDGSKYVIVPRFTSAATTKGTKVTQNPNWINPATAPYEAALLLSPDAMKREYIVPDSQVGNLSWEPTNYMGEWKWVTGPDAISEAAGDGCVDPLHKQGRHFGEILCAPRPGANPRSGAILFYRRCATNADLSYCS